jgi:hypothetical protein
VLLSFKGWNNVRLTIRIHKDGSSHNVDKSLNIRSISWHKPINHDQFHPYKYNRWYWSWVVSCSGTWD